MPRHGQRGTSAVPVSRGFAIRVRLYKQPVPAIPMSIRYAVLNWDPSARLGVGTPRHDHRHRPAATPEKQRKPSQRGRVVQGKSRNLLLHLHHYLSDYLRFAYDFGVPFDNNQAERDLRMAKVKQKVSGCHRSRGTAQAFARIRSYLLTAKRQVIHAAQALADLFAWQEIPLQIV